MYNLQQLYTAFLCSFTMCFRMVYKIKQRTELQFVPFRALLFLFRAIPHNSKCRHGERGAADAKPKAQIILDAAKVSAASGGNSEPKHDAGTAPRHYRAFWQRRCRAAVAGAVLEPLGGNCAVLP